MKSPYFFKFSTRFFRRAPMSPLKTAKDGGVPTVCSLPFPGQCLLCAPWRRAHHGGEKPWVMRFSSHGLKDGKIWPESEMFKKFKTTNYIYNIIHDIPWQTKAFGCWFLGQPCMTLKVIPTTSRLSPESRADILDPQIVDPKNVPKTWTGMCGFASLFVHHNGPYLNSDEMQVQLELVLIFILQLCCQLQQLH